MAHPCRGPPAPVILHPCHRPTDADELRRASPTVTSGCTSRASVATAPESPVHVIARGRGVARCGTRPDTRLLDGLSGLFTVQVGPRSPWTSPRLARRPGGDARTTSRCGPTPTRPRSSFATRLCHARAPATSTASSSPPVVSEAVESAWEAGAPSTSAPSARSNGTRVIARHTAYHGTTLGALADHRRSPRAWRETVRAGHPPAPSPRVQHQTRRRHPLGDDDHAFHARPLTDEIEGRASCPKDPRPSPRSSSSRWQKRGAGCLVPPEGLTFQRGGARSATATACCSCPTR